jgi:hypothetical protein
MSGDGDKREILKPGDTLDDLSNDPSARAEAEARAARRALEDQERQRQEDEKKRKAEAERALGWHGRLWRRIRAFGERASGPFVAIGAFVSRRMPLVASAFGVIERLIQNYVWPVVLAVAVKTDQTGARKLTLAGRAMIATVVFLVAWPFFKIYYVLGTTRVFKDVHITFKQIIDNDRYLVFGDYVDADGKENMAFNITDSWVYWNWTPDLTFAQVPVVGSCDFHTYGWYVRVPRFVPFFGRTLLVEPVVIAAKCVPSDLPATKTGFGTGTGTTFGGGSVTRPATKAV